MTDAAAADAATTTTTTKVDTGAADKAASAVSGTGSSPTIVGSAAATTADATAVAADATKVAPDWREDWREKLAAGDAKEIEQLKRYSSPIDVWRKARALEQRISSGELKAPPAAYPDKGTPEQQAAWRKDNGVPDKPEDYKIELKGGMVLGEADKPVVDDFAKRMHGKNWSNAQVNDAIQTYFEIQDTQAQQIKAADDEYRGASEESLRAEWGRDYKPYTAAIDNFLGSLPDGIGELIANGRLADGRRIGADARVIRAFKSIAFDLNPAASLLPSGGENGKTLDARLTEIRNFRRENPDGYDQNKAMQAEEVKLIEAQLRLRPSRAA